MIKSHCFFFFFFVYIINHAKPEKTLEINFYKNMNINESDYSDLINNKIFSIFKIGSLQKHIDLPIYFDTPYFSLPFKKIETSSTYKALDSDFITFSNTEFTLAQRAEEKIEVDENVIINDFKFISDKIGEGKLGLNLNYENDELKDFIFIKELLQKNLIESDFIKIKYNENDFTSGKLIFGASPKYTLSMHIEDESIFSFRIDQITYQGEDYTTDIGIDFNSAGILAPGSFFKRIEKFFEPYINNKTCKYIILPKSYDFSVLCFNNFTQIEKFGSIVFNINDFELRHSFVIEGKELFMKINNEYLFLIRTNAYYTGEKWVLGLPFFGKYPVSFDLKNKLIGLDINKESNPGNGENNDSIVPWILLGVLGFVFILIIAFNIYIFVFKRQRKERANELKENIIYNDKNEEDNKLGI